MVTPVVRKESQDAVWRQLHLQPCHAQHYFQFDHLHSFCSLTDLSSEIFDTTESALPGMEKLD